MFSNQNRRCAAIPSKFEGSDSKNNGISKTKKLHLVTDTFQSPCDTVRVSMVHNHRTGGCTNGSLPTRLYSQRILLCRLPQALTKPTGQVNDRRLASAILTCCMSVWTTACDLLVLRTLNQTWPSVDTRHRICRKCTLRGDQTLFSQVSRFTRFTRLTCRSTVALVLSKYVLSHGK